MKRDGPEVDLREPAFFAALADFDPSRLPPTLRGRLKGAWAESALAEHASIASFSRFALELLAVAAPPELIAEAHRAALDEVRHARLSFTLASAYAGEPVGPGPLDLPPDLLRATTLAAVAAAAVREGCVEETLAALEAEQAAALASEPAARLALEIIAADEARHAELAWTFVRWTIGVGGAEVRTEVERAFSESLAVAALSPLETLEDAELEAHGRISGRRRAAVRERALKEVLPAAIAALRRSYGG